MTERCAYQLWTDGRLLFLCNKTSGHDGPHGDVRTPKVTATEDWQSSEWDEYPADEMEQVAIVGALKSQRDRRKGPK